VASSLYPSWESATVVRVLGPAVVVVMIFSTLLTILAIVVMLRPPLPMIQPPKPKTSRFPQISAESSRKSLGRKVPEASIGDTDIEVGLEEPAEQKNASGLEQFGMMRIEQTTVVFHEDFKASS
jgi:hypothetical protein